MMEVLTGLWSGAWSLGGGQVCRELDLWISREAPTCRDDSSDGDGDQAAGATRGGTSLAG